MSASHTSVSQAILARNFLNVEKSGNALTKIGFALQFLNAACSSTCRLGETGPCDVTASIRNIQFLEVSNSTMSGSLSCTDADDLGLKKVVLAGRQ